MSDKLEKWEKNNREKQKKPSKEEHSPAEEKAFAKIRSEAKEAGATLLSDGEGGLPPSLVLGVLRRDKFTCKTCGKKKNISLHHKGGVVESKWLSKKGHSNDPNNIATICEECHNRVHEEAREKGIDSSQVLPEGDKGNPRRDHGQPDAHPKK